MLALAAVLGLADSVYLTVSHYSASPLACVNSGIVNCELVTRSSYGLVPGTSLPVSLAGVLWFAISLVLSLIPGRGPGPGLLPALHALWALGGTVVVLYLVYAELRLGRICEWCTLSHVLVVLSLLVSVARLSPRPGPTVDG